MSASTSTTHLTPRTRAHGPESVLIIGGGATGLVALRNISIQTGNDSQGSYPLFDPLLVERRDNVGGVWYWSDHTYSLERTIGAQNTQGLSPVYDPNGHPHWPSPAYLNLRGNVLPEFLEFSANKFPPPAHGQTFPSLDETHQYLKAFAQPYTEFIRCGIEVLRVQELPNHQGWQVTLKHWRKNAIEARSVSFTPTVETKRFDRVIVAAGWYDSPYYPDTPGIHQAKEAGHVHHSKHYRDSTPYKRKRVVVVGNNNSANEIAAHLAPFNSKQSPVFRSSKHAPDIKCPALADERIKDVGMIKQYKLVLTSTSGKQKATKLDLTLTDGRVIRSVDFVILGTGYRQKYPWVHVLTDEARKNGTTEVQPLTPEQLKGTRVPDMYNFALYSKSPRLTLGFVGLVVSTMPFSFNDLLSAWIAAVWAGKITSIPASIQERLKNPQARLDYLYKRRLASAQPDEKIDPNDPLTYVGYHALLGSLKEGPPSEMHFASGLYDELAAADPARAAQWEWKWDEARQEKQMAMWRRKKQWLEQNADRIRNDPFDLLGTNNVAYGHLVAHLVHPSWAKAKGVDTKEIATTPHAHLQVQGEMPVMDMVMPQVAEMLRKPALYAYMLVMDGLAIGMLLLMLWLLSTVLYVVYLAVTNQAGDANLN